MAFRLFKNLQSPQLRKNLDRQAEQVRFREFRRTQGRPGITNQGFFPSGGTAPIPTQIAAGRISSQLGTDFGSELNRLTAPDPASFARGARAPEFVGQELEFGRTGITEAELRNQAAETELPFIAPRRQQELDVGEFGLETGRAEEAQRELLRPGEVFAAEQEIDRGRLDIAGLEREAEGAPTPEEIIQDRQAARELLQETAEQGLNQQRLDEMNKAIDRLEAQGDLDGANRIQQQIDALLSGEEVPAGAPTAPGGAPIPTRATTNPRLLEVNASKATQLGIVFGMEGIQKALASIAGDVGLPNRDTPEKMSMLLGSIEDMLAAASDTGAPPTTRDMVKTKLKGSEGYISLKKRAGFGDLARRFHGASLSPLVTGIATGFGITRPTEAGNVRKMAQQIVELVERD